MVHSTQFQDTGFTILNVTKIKSAILLICKSLETKTVSLFIL